MATSPKPAARRSGSGGKGGSGRTPERLSAAEERCLEIAMGALDQMSDEEYRKAMGKIERLVKDSRASS